MMDITAGTQRRRIFNLIVGNIFVPRSVRKAIPTAFDSGPDQGVIVVHIIGPRITWRKQGSLLRSERGVRLRRYFHQFPL